MKISVIMLTYNRQDLIGRMIESVQRQNFEEFEFIVVDNGSTDSSGVIADAFAKEDSRIRVVHKEKGNIGSGRNAGLGIARGEYIAFVDDDDYLEPDYLDYLYRLAVDHKADVAICGSWREVAGKKQPKYIFDGIQKMDGERAVYEMLKRKKFNSATPTKLISREIFKELRFPDTGKYDDVELTYKIIAGANAVVLSGKPLYTFVRHTTNNSRGTTEGELIYPHEVREYLDVFRERTQWLSERYPDMAEYWLYTELSYALSMYEKVPDPELREELRLVLRDHMETWLNAEQYYTERDRKLWNEFGGVIL